MRNFNRTQIGMMAASVLLLTTTSFALHEEPPPSLCFNFDQPITHPLGQVLKHNGPHDVMASGRLNAERGFWTAVSGEVHNSLPNIYNQLLDPYTIKDRNRLSLRTYPQDRAGYDNFNLVLIELNVPIIPVKWEEEWGYVITRGTPKDPRTAVISYQKTAGSPLLPHLCGSIVLNKIDAHHTDVYLYEEVKARNRPPADSMRGHLGTLRTLRSNSNRNIASFTKLRPHATP